MFTDLPAYTERLVEPPTESLEGQSHLPPGFIGEVLLTARERLNPSVTAALPQEAQEPRFSKKIGRTVLIGGPGQGKTTLGQFVCQLFRTALLKDLPSHLITPPARDVLDGIKSFCESEGIELPAARRFPLRIELSKFASALAAKETTGVSSILSFLTKLIEKRTNQEISPNDFRQWLREYPWIIIFDGLDEVPSSSNRTEVLSAIQDFWVDATQADADLLIIATTRPQGYNDDFSPLYYEHKWLAPLSTVRALHYGKLLAQARYGNDSERCNKVITRLERASEHEATARVMRSPLQVTIMATLVDRMGQPPQERWQLFKAYYDIIYQREVERDIPPATILRDYRSDIDAIHSRVGLLLQIESERAGGTEAQLTSDRFALVVHDRLASEGHEGVELEELKSRIIQAATDRLVFLVGLQVNRVGFEIRSLQEFMASEALMDGSDEVVKRRLRRIAVVANWRNVFLFAAGKCFAVQQALRDTIATIASQLNDDPEDETASTTLAGSQLCLDLLEDGPASRQPKYARILARTALRLLRLPPGALQRRLASLYEPQFQEIFKDEISHNLKQIVPEQRLGAWVCLLSLMESNVDWAEPFGSEYQPESEAVYDLLRIASLATFSRPRRSWLKNQTINILPFLSPVTLSEIFRANRSLHEIFGDADEPWLKAAGNVLAERLTHGRNEIGINLTGQVSEDTRGAAEHVPIKLYNTPLHGNYSPKIVPLKDMPSHSEEWDGLIASARFLQSPSKGTLAEQLREIAKTFNPDIIKWPGSRLPWALAACVGMCSTQGDVLAIADRAELGEFGDTEEWEQAEERWHTVGLKSHDFLFMANDRWPLTNTIAVEGFSFSDFTMSTAASRTDDLLEHIRELFKLHSKVGKCKVQSTIAYLTLFGMSVLHHSRSGLAFSLSPDEFLELVDNVQSERHALWVDALGSVSLNDPLAERWINAIDCLGRKDSLACDDIKEPVVKVICDAFMNHPDKHGLLRLLAIFAIRTNIPAIPLELIDPARFTDSKFSEAATILTLIQAAPPDNGPSPILGFTVSLLKNHPELDISSLTKSNELRKSGSEMDSFLVNLMRELDSANWPHRQQIIRSLQDSITRRTSNLAEPKVWLSLELPQGLSDIFADTHSS